MGDETRPGGPLLKELHYDEQGLRMKMKCPEAVFIMQELAKLFYEMGGTNYLEVRGTTEETGPLCITIQREEGKTPGQVVAELKRDRANLLALVEEASGVYGSPDWRGAGWWEKWTAKADALIARIKGKEVACR